MSIFGRFFGSNDEEVKKRVEKSNHDIDEKVKKTTSNFEESLHELEVLLQHHQEEKVPEKKVRRA